MLVHDVATLHIAKRTHAFFERLDEVCGWPPSCDQEYPDARYLPRLLRLGGERCEQRPKSWPAEERSPFHHSISWSARNSKDCGIMSPSDFTVLRLITNSNLVGCSTGRSAGCAPLRILSTKEAARRKVSLLSRVNAISPPLVAYSRSRYIAGSRAPATSSTIR